MVFFSLILISDWLKLLCESIEENTIYFVFLEMCMQKFKVTEFEFLALKLFLSQKNYVPPITGCGRQNENIFRLDLVVEVLKL